MEMPMCGATRRVPSAELPNSDHDDMRPAIEPLGECLLARAGGHMQATGTLRWVTLEHHGAVHVAVDRIEAPLEIDHTYAKRNLTVIRSVLEKAEPDVNLSVVARLSECCIAESVL